MTQHDAHAVVAQCIIQATSSQCLSVLGSLSVSKEGSKNICLFRTVSMYKAVPFGCNTGSATTGSMLYKWVLKLNVDPSILTMFHTTTNWCHVQFAPVLYAVLDDEHGKHYLFAVYLQIKKKERQFNIIWWLWVTKCIRQDENNAA